MTEPTRLSKGHFEEPSEELSMFTIQIRCFDSSMSLHECPSPESSGPSIASTCCFGLTGPNPSYKAPVSLGAGGAGAKVAGRVCPSPPMLQGESAAATSFRWEATRHDDDFDFGTERCVLDLHHGPSTLPESKGTLKSAVKPRGTAPCFGATSWISKRAKVAQTRSGGAQAYFLTCLWCCLCLFVCTLELECETKHPV